MDQPQYCPFCQRKNSHEVQHCVHCGVPLVANRRTPITTVGADIAPQERPSSQSDTICNFWQHRLPLDTAALISAEAKTKPLIINANRIVIGRGDDAPAADYLDLSHFGDPAMAISRRHVLIERSEGVFMLEDLGSTNGSWLNNQRVAPKTRYPLESGDRLWLGPLKLTFCVGKGTIAATTNEIEPKHEGQDSDKIVRILLSAREPLTAVQALTPAYLQDPIGPYLEAIAQLQRHAREWHKQSSHQLVSIKELQARGNNVYVTLAHAREALMIIDKWINPWRARFIQEELPVGGTHILQPQLLPLAQEIVQQNLPDDALENASGYVKRVLTELRALATSPLDMVLLEISDPH